MTAFDPSRLELPACHHIGGAPVQVRPAIEVRAPSDGRYRRDIPKVDAEAVDQAVTAARAALARSGWAEGAPATARAP